ncbi:MAG TPA: hypothetical protein VFN35_12570 [Ktedonobacteraceae bacterium]|nr:hypothetical protein [Ktedonobacteraceae bacterium]
MPNEDTVYLDPDTIDTEDLEEEAPRRRASRSARRQRRGFLQHWSRLHKKLGSSPLIMFFLGGLVILLWLSGTVVQIQTSELLALGNSLRVANINWNVLAQPWLMISGQAPMDRVTSWLYGWVVEVVTLVFALALSVAVVKISSLNARFGRLFVVAGFLLIGLNGWADYSASPGSSPLVQFLIALAIGIIVTVGLPLGIGLIEQGIEEL